MKNASDSLFYSHLPVHKTPLSDLLITPGLMTDLPSSWHVVITDIRGSTRAVLDGKHEQVNLIATGSIVTVLNIAFRSGINIPFFFGGDGATFIVPESIIDPIMASLAGYRAHTKPSFGLDLRTGTVPVTELYRSGHRIQIAKYCSSERFVIPVVLGQGLSYAEKLIKSRDMDFNIPALPPREPDLNGIQCRWDRIAPPNKKAEILTLLVSSPDLSSQAPAFANVLSKIEKLYGPFTTRQPISVSGLKLKSTFKQLKTQISRPPGNARWTDVIDTWLDTIYCQLYFRTRQGKNFLERIVEMSDTLVIDGRINTVISGTTTQRIKLLQYLDELEHSGKIIYGSHISSGSIMSCYVRDQDQGHIHFVDGAEGGYTHAAMIWKRKASM